MAVKNYGIFDKWLNSEQQNVVDVKSTDGVINSVKVNGQEYGGGGSSDFSTATVTVTLTKTGGSGLGGIELRNFPYVYEDAVLFTNPGTSGTYEVPLYKGVADCEPYETGTASISDVDVSGNAQIDGGTIMITGDCTITIEFTTGN